MAGTITRSIGERLWRVRLFYSVSGLHLLDDVMEAGQEENGADPENDNGDDTHRSLEYALTPSPSLVRELDAATLARSEECLSK